MRIVAVSSHLDNPLYPAYIASCGEQIVQINTIEAVLFDAGQVLVTVDEMVGARKLSELTGIEAKKIAVAFGERTLYREYEYSQVGAQRFLRSIIQMLKKLDPQAHVVKSWDAEKAFAEWITGEVEGMNALIRRLRPGVRKLIVSNTNPIHWTRVQLRAPVVELFRRNDTVLSFAVGMKKPDEAMFREALRRAEIPASHALLIDDRTDNCAAFRGLGGRTIQFDCREHDAAWLEKEMAAYGVF